MRETIWDVHEAVARGDEDLAEILIRQHGENASSNLAFLLIT